MRETEQAPGMLRKLGLQYPGAIYHLMRRWRLGEAHHGRRWRRESTMPLKWICERLAMGSWKSVNQGLYEHSHTNC